MTDDGSERPRLRFTFEWHVEDLLWAMDDSAFELFDAGPVSYDEVGLPEQLGERMERLSQWHDESLNWDYPPAPGPWRQDECDRFNAEARRLFEEVRARLADRFDVVWDAETVTEDPDLDEYLSSPDTYWRRKLGAKSGWARWTQKFSALLRR
jgi:hypothetical protein